MGWDGRCNGVSSPVLFDVFEVTKSIQTSYGLCSFWCCINFMCLCYKKYNSVLLSIFGIAHSPLYFSLSLSVFFAFNPTMFLRGLDANGLWLFSNLSAWARVFGVPQVVALVHLREQMPSTFTANFISPAEQLLTVLRLSELNKSGN